MKAYLIDVAARQVREVSYETSGESSLQSHIGGYIEAAWGSEAGDVLFVDEDGLHKPQKHFFRWQPRGSYPFAGHGILVGPERYDDKGEYLGNDPPVIGIEAVRDMVTFLSREHAESWGKANASDPAVAISFGGDPPEVIATMGQVFAEMPKLKPDDVS